MKQLYFAFFSLLTAFALIYDADAKDLLVFGDYRHQGIVISNADLALSLPHSSCSNSFDIVSVKGNAISFGCEKTFGSSFSGFVGLGYSYETLLFESVKYEVIGLDDNYYNGKIISTPEIKNNNLTLKTGIRYHKLFKKVLPSIEAEISYSFANRYNYREKLVEPTDRGVFKETGDRIRNEYTANSYSRGLSSSLSLVAGYEIALGTSGKESLMPYISGGLLYYASAGINGTAKYNLFLLRVSAGLSMRVNISK